MSTVARMRSNSTNNSTKAKKAGRVSNINNKPTGVQLRRSTRHINNKVDRSSDLDAIRNNSKRTGGTIPSGGSIVRQRVAALESNGKAPVTPPQRQKLSTTTGETNSIMSPPKRNPRESAISGTNEGLMRKRRRAEIADSNHNQTTPGFHTPLLKRKHHNLRNMTTAAEEEDLASPSTYKCAKRKQSGDDIEMGEREEQPRTPTRAEQKQRQQQQEQTELNTTPSNSRDDEVAPSPLKSILSPVFDLLRRVSGIAQDPLGLQNRPDDTTPSVDESPLAGKGKRSLRSTESEISDYSIPGGFYGQLATLETGGMPPPGSIEANSLTAPPMNPTTTTLTSYLSHHRAQPSSSSNSSNNGNSLSANDMQLYLPESVEFGGPDSCSASPLTAGFPETPSKENIPIHNYSDGQTDDGATTLNELLALSHGNDVVNGDDTVNAYSRYLATLRPTVADPNRYVDYLQYEEEEEEDLNPYLFMANLPPIPKEHTLRPYALPRKTRSCKPITLVLDLDETLVHCAINQVENPDLIFPVDYNGINYNVYCRLRPGYKEFLERASQLFEVVIFTASQQVYADRLLNMIDRDRKLIKHRLFRDSCVYVNANYVKDLGILGRDESKMILVDNCPQAYAYQQSNGIPIESWYEDRTDRELSHLMEFLETLVDVEDVRPLVESRYGTKERVDEARRKFQIRMAAAASII